MMTFVQRDARLAAIRNAEDALRMAVKTGSAALDGGHRASLKELQRRLEDERRALERNRFETSDEYAGAIVRYFRDEAPDQMSGILRTEPVQAAYRFLMTSPGKLPGLLHLPTVPDAPSLPAHPLPGAGGHVPVAGKADAGMLLGHFLTSDPATRIAPFREVGVLLPLRLETLFEKDGNGGWTLSLRVLPDEASVRRDRPTISRAEFDFLAAFWARSADPKPDTDMPQDWLRSPGGSAAFADLAARVTAPRAAYLASAFKPRFADGFFVLDEPAGRVGEPEHDRIAGLPPELFVTLEDDNAGRVALGSLTPNLPDEEFRIPKDESAFDTWMFSWERAQKVGMGKEFALPAGVGPETIRALYVCGIGEAQPAEHFGGHADAGDLALMRLGSPTNTIQGEPAADLGRDAEDWRAIAASRIAGEQAPGAAPVAQALGGSQASLPFVAGGSADIEDGQLIARALSPALWGHWIRDIWRGLDGWLPCWRWGLDNVHPQGPFLPIRIGAQPYGLLPVTGYDNWQAAGDAIDDRLESIVVRIVGKGLPDWVKAAQDSGTIVDAGTEQLLDKLARGGVSADYIYRTFLDATRLSTAYGNPADFLKRAKEIWLEASRAVVPVTPERLYLAIGEPHALRLPLVGSDRLFPLGMSFEKLLDTLYGMDTEAFAETLYSEKILQGIVPHSLLARLMIHSVLLAKAWFMQAIHGDADPLRNPEQFDASGIATKIEQHQIGFPGSFAAGAGPPELHAFVKRHRADCEELAKRLDAGLGKGEDPVLHGDHGVATLQLEADAQAAIERSMRATLDCAGYRIDPYATAVAYSRLLDHTASDKARHRLGAYGWLDGPFRGSPGPTAAGRLHAPSRAQALTGIILRDKDLSSQREADERWKMDLSSGKVRTAVEIAEELRMGFHYYEVVGRRVEAIVGAPDRIRILRKAKPLRAAAPDARDSCQGPDALAALLADSIPGVLSDRPDEKKDQIDALRALDAALAAYADLTVAEGVYQIVSGNPARAADAADAGAGLGRPAAFEVMRTPPSGYRLGTSVLAVMPYAAPGGALPIERADASLAAFLAGSFADAAQFVWSAAWEGGQAGVSLADLDIAPLEAVTIAEDFLADAVRSRIGRPQARVDTAARYKLLRALAGSLGSPAELSDVARDPNVPDQPQRQSAEAIRGELAARYQALCTALSDLIADGAGAADDAARKAWLRKTLPWGFSGLQVGALRAPLTDLLFGALPADAGMSETEVIAALVQSAVKALQDRLARVTGNADPAKPNALAALSRAIVELVSPGGRLALTARWSAAELGQASGIDAAAPLGEADAPWLSPLAAVRPQLARLEAAQLQATHLAHMAPLAGWANTQDLWRTDVVAANAGLRRKSMQERQAAGEPKLDLSRLVVAYGPQGVLAGADVAVALIDQFTEAVPVAERTSSVGFGFNAPAARPPQAILLAVPPRSDGGLDETVILDILADTRKLLRARAARPEDVGNQGMLPAMWFDAASPLQVRLDAGSQYHR